MAPTEIYTLSLHDALPIWETSIACDGITRLARSGLNRREQFSKRMQALAGSSRVLADLELDICSVRSEEHTSELQSHSDLVCRLLLEKKNILLYNIEVKDI